MRWRLTVVLIWTWLVVMPLTFLYTCKPFVCLWISFNSFAHVLIRLVVFMLLNCRSSLNISGINLLLYIWFINIFSWSMGCLFTIFSLKLLTVVSNAAINMGLQISFCVPCFNPFRYILRSGIAESCGHSIFYFLEEMSYYFPQQLHNFSLHWLMQNCSYFSTSLSVLVTYFKNKSSKWLWSGISQWFWFAFPNH